MGLTDLDLATGRAAAVRPSTVETLPDHYFERLDRDRFTAAVRRLRRLLG
ncbi:hypothetical protein ABZ754_18970 [Micromonospora purpureochromogenes]